ncbi:MAG TPA: hypothetical protein VIG49_13190, partial [Acetobacteraceae bacterium]
MTPDSTGAGADRVRIVLLDGSAADSDRLERQLARAGLPIDLRRAGDRQSFAEAIAAGGFDLVLADPDVPG